MQLLQAEDRAGQIKNAMKKSGITVLPETYTHDLLEPDDVSIMIPGSVPGTALIFAVHALTIDDEENLFFEVVGQLGPNCENIETTMPKTGIYQFASLNWDSVRVGKFRAEFDSGMGTALDKCLEAGMKWYKFFMESPLIDTRFGDNGSIELESEILVDKESCEYREKKKLYGLFTAEVECALILSAFPVQILGQEQQRLIVKNLAIIRAGT